MNDAAALAELLGRRSIRHGDFVLASGAKSTYYIDCRPSTMSGEGQALIGRMGLAALRAVGWAPRAVGGLTMGADPVAYAVARASVDHPPAIDAFSVRKQAKEHGTGKRVAAEGGIVLGVLAVVDREQGGRAKIEAAGFPVTTLVTATTLGLRQ
jgi:orotate phosphoribosyltransferase